MRYKIITGMFGSSPAPPQQQQPQPVNTIEIGDPNAEKDPRLLEDQRKRKKDKQGVQIKRKNPTSMDTKPIDKGGLQI